MRKNSTLTLPVPTEAEEQIALFEWATLQSGRFPELALLYHVPNGGSRNKIEAARQRIASQVAKNAEQAHGAPSGAGREIRRSRSLPSGCTRGKSRAIH